MMINAWRARLYRLLRWSEKYTKTDMVYLTLNSSYLLANDALMAILAFTTAVAFANFLPKDVYGGYQYILSMSATFGIFSLSGLNTALTQAVARNNLGNVWITLKRKFLSTLLGSVALFITALYYIDAGNASLGIAFLCISLILPFYESSTIYDAILQGGKRFKQQAKYSFFAHFLTAGISIFLVYTTNNLVILAVSYFFFWALIRITLLKIVSSRYVTNSRLQQKSLDFGTNISIIQLFSAAVNNLDKILLWHLSGPTFVANYVFAQTIPLRLSGLLKIINRIAFPKFAQADFVEIQNSLPKKIFLVTLASISVAGLYVLTAPHIFHMFFSQYTDAVLFSQLLSIIIILQPAQLLLTAMNAHTQLKQSSIFLIISPVVKIILLVSMIPSIGIMGGVIAIIVSQIFDSVLLFVLFKSRQNAQ